MPRVWFIRHGQSEANAGLRSVRTSTIPLTALGRAQSEALARRFPEPPARLLVSPYLRARQTAEPTQARFPALDAETCPVQEFTYLAPERCRDTTSAERRPMVEHFWSREDPDHVDGPGAESFRHFLGRVDGLIERLHRERGPLVAVFTHGQFMQAVMWRLGAGGQPTGVEQMAGFRAFMLTTPVMNTAVLEVELGPGHARILGMDTAHLGELPVTV